MGEGEKREEVRTAPDSVDNLAEDDAANNGTEHGDTELARHDEMRRRVVLLNVIDYRIETLSLGRRPAVSHHTPATDHATDYTTDHNTDHATDHTPDHTADHATDHATDHTTDHATDHTTDHATDHTTNHATEHATDHTTDHTTDHATDTTDHATDQRIMLRISPPLHTCRFLGGGGVRQPCVRRPATRRRPQATSDKRRQT